MRRKILLSSSGTMFAKIAQAGLGLVTALVLTRTFGIETFGIYSYAIAVATLGAVFTRFGFHVYVVYAINAAIAENQQGRVATILLTAFGLTAVLSAVLGMCIYSVSLLQPDWEMAVALRYSAVLLAAVAILQVSAGAMQAFGRVVLGVSLEGIGKPVLFLSLLALYMALRGSDETGYRELLILYICSEVILIAIVGVMLSFWTLREMGGVSFQRSQVRSIIIEARPFLMANAMIQLYQQTGIFAMGVFFSASSVALFRIATQVASLIPFGLQALQAVMRPRIARMIKAGEHDQLQIQLTWTTRILLILQSPIIIITLFFADQIISIFGADYQESAKILVFLSIGQSFSIICGMNGDVLNMSGNANINARWSAIALIIMLILVWPAVELFGYLGPAISLCISRLLWNSALVLNAARYTWLHTTVFGRLNFLNL
jgi:O-antigen/teichoic acid export membrane protein